MDRLAYEGPVYIRAMDRGISLEQTGSALLHEIKQLVGVGLEDYWEGDLRSLVERVKAPPD